ncbi:MAG: aspartate/glutamate racemase family protein [Rhodobacteraceae bacterium]|nr:aspartate/glutamate racemase family protein [Paracoccaceae bacterium]
MQRNFKIGVLIPFTNTNLEPDLGHMCPANTTFHFTRIGGYDLDEIPDAGQMQDMGGADISAALRLIAGVRPDMVLYGCTSATLTHGVAFDRRLAARIQAEMGVPAVTAAGALVKGLQAVNARQIGFASPYVGAINRQAVAFLDQAGFETVNIAKVEGTLNSHQQGELTVGQIVELALQADHPDADAIVMACTDLRAVEAISQIEAALKKPVITSNQAMIHAVGLSLGVWPVATGFGRLFDL